MLNRLLASLEVYCYHFSAMSIGSLTALTSWDCHRGDRVFDDYVHRKLSESINKRVNNVIIIL